MAVDHVFVDSPGNRVQGATSMESGWRRYFEMCPDYWNRADHAIAEGETMLVAGECYRDAQLYSPVAVARTAAAGKKAGREKVNG